MISRRPSTNIVWTTCLMLAIALSARDAAAQWRGPYGYGYPVRFCCDSSARLDVTPREAEVYVDGYFAGIVDEFDGTFQRLSVPPGEHELELWLDGYRTFKQKALFTPGRTLKVKATLEKLPPGEAPEPRPQGRQATQPAASEAGPGAPATRRRQPMGYFGTVSLRIQPADAEVLIDDQPWQNPEGENRIQIQVAEGPHRIEVRKEGFKPYVTTVRVRRGDTVTLNVRLPREDP